MVRAWLAMGAVEAREPTVLPKLMMFAQRCQINHVHRQQCAGKASSQRDWSVSATRLLLAAA
jgi:hypothetical protein